MKAFVWEEENVPVSAWLVVSICHRSPAAPDIGSVTLQLAPLSNQYPVAVVVKAGPTEEPRIVEVIVGELGEPPAVIEYERVSRSS